MLQSGDLGEREAGAKGPQGAGKHGIGLGHWGCLYLSEVEESNKREVEEFKDVDDMQMLGISW